MAISENPFNACNCCGYGFEIMDSEALPSPCDCKGSGPFLEQWEMVLAGITGDTFCTRWNAIYTLGLTFQPTHECQRAAVRNISNARYWDGSACAFSGVNIVFNMFPVIEEGVWRMSLNLGNAVWEMPHGNFLCQGPNTFTVVNNPNTNCCDGWPDELTITAPA